MQFRSIINAKQGAKHYVLHDYMETGLELVTTAEGTDETDIYAYAKNASDKYDYSPKVYLVRRSDIHKIQQWSQHAARVSSSTCRSSSNSAYRVPIHKPPAQRALFA